MPKHELDSMTAWLDEVHRPLLISHARPDGDALGGLAGLDLALRRRGQEPTVALFDVFPRRYAFLEGLTTWQNWDAAREVLAGECDAVVILDTCSLSQLEPIVDYLRSAPRILVVDHHGTRDEIGAREGDLRVIDERAGAACLILAEWIRAAGVALDASIATALFVGIATDCGWFRYSNTDGRLMRVAAELLEAGVPMQGIREAIYQQDEPARLRLLARALRSLQLHADDALATMELRAADFEAAGADMTMTEDFVNEPLRLGCVETSVLLTDAGEGVIRANFRSKRALDVSALASRFGGGGHARAAGARLRGSWEQVVPRLIVEAGEATRVALAARAGEVAGSGG